MERIESGIFGSAYSLDLALRNEISVAVRLVGKYCGLGDLIADHLTDLVETRSRQNGAGLREPVGALRSNFL